jgi:hypothetical protein
MRIQLCASAVAASTATHSMPSGEKRREARAPRSRWRAPIAMKSGASAPSHAPAASRCRGSATSSTAPSTPSVAAACVDQACRINASPHVAAARRRRARLAPFPSAGAESESSRRRAPSTCPKCVSVSTGQSASATSASLSASAMKAACATSQIRPVATATITLPWNRRRKRAAMRTRSPSAAACSTGGATVLQNTAVPKAESEAAICTPRTAVRPSSAVSIVRA